MATQVQLRRGTSAENDSFTGAQGELTYDTTNKRVRIHDGGTAGGFETARADASNLKFPDGAVGTPAISFSSDTNTGIYRGGTDILKFVTAGTDAITIDASQDVTLAGSLNFADNEKAIFGASGDLQIFHSVTASHIGDVGTGNLYIYGDGDVQILNQALTQYKARFITGGAVDLWHNAVKKFSTTSTGIDVTGTAVTDGLTVAGNVSVDGGTIKLDGNYPVGSGNVALGDTALDSISGANNNVAIGNQSLTSNTSGSSLTAIGGASLYSNTTASNNVAVGFNAGYSITEGANNSVLGTYALDALTEGIENVAFGYNALGADVKGNNSIAIGSKALQSQSFSGATDVYNTAVGHNAGKSVTTGIRNVLIGGLAGDLFNDADYNVAVGYQTLSADTKGSGSVAIGYKALSNQNFTSSTNTYNTAVGYLAGQLISTGTKNTIIGGYNGNQGSLDIRTSSNQVILSDGDGNVCFRADSTTQTLIGSVANRLFLIDANRIASSDINGGTIDNQHAAGWSNRRLTVVYAVSGSINTSDENEKQDIESLSETETRVAVACKGLIKKYRWKDSVAKKGDDARIHVGIIAQELKSAFEAEGLDATKYGMFCSDTWWEKDETVDGVTSTKDYQTEDEAPEGATKKTRLGVRYEQLLAFIISAI